MSLIRCGGPSAVRTRTAASCCGTRPSIHVSSGNVVITGIDQIRYWRGRSFLIWINGCPEKSPPTFGLGNRFGYRYFSDLRPNVANVLHPFPLREILIACPRIVGCGGPLK